MKYRNTFSLGALMLLLVGCASQAQIEKENNYSAIISAHQASAAAEFVSRHTGVDAEEVSVHLLEKTSEKVSAKTFSPGGRVCNLTLLSTAGPGNPMGMVSVKTPYGWRLNSISCNPLMSSS